MAETQAETYAKKYATELQHTIDKEHVHLTVEAHAEKHGNVFHMKVYLKDPATKERVMVDIFRAGTEGDLSVSVKLKADKKLDKLESVDLEAWGRTLHETWTQALIK